MSDTSTCPRKLSAQERRDLLIRSLQQNSRPVQDKSRNPSRAYPMSLGQKALWFLQQSAPASAAYHVAFAARIRSRVNVPALQQALQMLLNRHPALRTNFQSRDGEQWQIVNDDQEVTIRQLDASAWEWNELNERVIEAYRRPFDLEQGPLLRVELFTRAAQDHVLLLTIHHIVHDAWSLWIFQDELRAALAAVRSGDPAVLPPVEHSYFDYVQWQAEMLAGRKGEQLWAYWQQQLAGAPTMLDLPADRARPAVQSQRGATFPFDLNAKLSRRLKDLAQKEGATPFMLLLAAFQVLLYRYTGQEDILVGSPVAGRGQPEFAGIVGYFVNPVVLRARFTGNPTFRSFLNQVRHTVLDAMANEDFPFPLLVQRLQPKRDASYSPLFQVSFVLQKAQRAGAITDSWVPGDTQTRMQWAGLEVELYDLAQQEGQFDLELEMMEAAGKYYAGFKYNTDLFDPDRMARMAQHLTVLLEAIVEDPDRRLGQLPLTTEAEQQQLLAFSNTAAGQLYDVGCLHRWFERQVTSSPEAIAVTFEDRNLSYRELNARANRLGNYLQSLGVGPDVLVGLCVERSLEMIVGILGILKAGGAYLPLDPSSPRERLAFVIADSAVPILLTQATRADELIGTEAKILRLDADWPLIAQSSDENPSSQVQVDNLAYVIYTSGSTGRPKGVQITHENVARLYTATDKWYRFDNRDVWTLFHSFAFDFSVWELWGALLHGGRLVVVPYWISRSPEDFLSLLACEGVTVLNQTPSAFRQLIQAEERSGPTRPLSLRLVIFGGEQLDPQSLAPWIDRHGDSSPQLVNMYGITETTVHVTYRPLTARDLASSRSVIGIPIPDLQILILDKFQQAVPIGVAGEIYVGGTGVARGYLNRPELNAERFISHPLSQQAGGRVYRTGDLARYLPGGDIEYLGRIDNQVKIRGFRIELGEIETVLLQCPQLREAVVTVSKEPSGDNRLVAYVVARQKHTSLATAELRKFLMEKLPAYMVPAVFVPLNELPLTNNGKIDYRALPSPDANRGNQDNSIIPARDKTEQRLVRLWESTLGVQPVGVRDNFFDLGGHSLLAVTLMVEIEQEFGKALPIATLFQNPTIEQLSVLIRDKTDAPRWSPLVPIQPKGEARPFFCVAGGGGNVLYFQRLARQLGEDQPFYGLQARGLDGESEPINSIEDIAQLYVEAIQTVQPQGPYRLGGHCFGGAVAFEMAQRLQRQGHAVEFLAILDSPAPNPEADLPADELDEASWLIKIADSIEEASGKSLGLTYEAIRELDPEERLRCFLEQLQRVGFLPPEAGLTQVRGLVNVSKINARAQRTYVPRDTHPTPITLYRARQIHPDYDYGAGCGETIEVFPLGWDRYADGPVTVELVPGNHITMLAEPHVDTLAERLGAGLRATGQRAQYTETILS